MSKTIHIRNVPDDLHRKLEARAAMSGMSLSDYLIGEMRKVAEKPTLGEMRARLAAREPVAAPLSPAEIIRERRGE